MPTYLYTCPNHGLFEMVLKMADYTSEYRCPDCGLVARRVYSSVPDIWNTDGAHKTDYPKGVDGETGDKRERLNRRWSKYYGEEAPPPAPDVPKNGSEKY